jgi:uncharacterized membrane protein YebE (DUF533 family)
MKLPPNRVVAISTALIALLLGLLPVLAEMDWTSTAGIIAGIVGLLTIAYKWLEGWQKWEALQVVASTPADDPSFPVLEDEAQSAEVVVG